MRRKLISCRVFEREFEALLASGPQAIEVEYLPMGLHTGTASEMRAALQAAIDASGAEYDAILLGFGLCNVGLPGLKARGVPVVIPRAHDCIAILLGGAERYRGYFDARPDSYFQTSGWVEYARETGGELEQNASNQMMGLDREYHELVEKYGEDNAKYLWEALHQYQSRYARFTFIETGLEGTDEYEKSVRLEAARRGCDFEKLRGDLRILTGLLLGDWDPAHFLVVPPGGEIELTYDERLIGCAPTAVAGGNQT